ncbi:MAG: aspartate aminotransferase family protein [Desulfurococcales archaeon]|nr:aspartate aminotransferase family protein [Desulfurococcales archaeon]
MDRSTQGLEALRARLEGEYTRKTPGSRALFERARTVLPGGVTYHIRYLRPYPPFIEKAEGTRVIDVDGNVYDDYWMGHGAHILGHTPDFVREAVCEASRLGSHLGYENPLAVEYAELLARIVPNMEMVRFTSSGTEANMYAVRLARAYTRRRYVVKMEGGWHGGYDGLHTGVTPPWRGPESLGLPEEYLKYTLVVPYNDADSLEAALKKHDVAAVVLEPVLGAGGCIEAEREYLREARRLASEYGALLIFDEVITGFRLALGGAQEYYGVDADIVVLGKAVAGGYPGAGAFGGRSEYMEMLDHIARPNPRERSFHGGTFSGNPVSIAAGKALVEYLAANRGIYEEANSLWEWFRRRIDESCEARDRPCWATGAGSMVGIHFTRSRPRSAREAHEARWGTGVESLANLYMRVRGILYLTEHTMHLLPSLRHTKKQASAFLEAFEAFLDDLEEALGGRPWTT